jgi:CheY-like chemotaxis protein
MYIRESLAAGSMLHQLAPLLAGLKFFGVNSAIELLALQISTSIHYMNKNGPIVVIEDDLDDQELLTEVFRELAYPNEIMFFGDGEKALEHITLTSIKPFIILSDINLPKLNGLALRQKLHNNEDLRLKTIPYLFFSTSAEQTHVVEAYSQSVQGFFVKPDSYTALKNTIFKIVEYWKECVSPMYIRNTQ